MSERDVPHRPHPDRSSAPSGVGGMFTMLESSAIVLSGFTLFLLYQLELGQVGSSAPRSDELWLFLPHVALVALIVGGLRRLASILATFLLLAGVLFGIVACADSLIGSHSNQSMGFASVLQLPIFILCFYSARDPIPLEELARRAPRLLLGVVVGAVGWFVATEAVARANKPYLERVAAEDTRRAREAARRDAKAQVIAIAGCLQRVPATPDSQTNFPRALTDLPKAECPEAAKPAPNGFVVEYVPGAADSAGDIHAFRLSAHDQPLTDSARTYLVDESMIVSEWYGHDTPRPMMNGASRMEMLAQVARCVEAARDTLGSTAGTIYPQSIGALARAARCDARAVPDSSAMLVPASSGLYVVRYTAPTAPRPRDAPAGYSLSIEPRRDSTGHTMGADLLGFYLDTAGFVHLSRRARTATASDSVLPDCPSYEARSRMRYTEMCREWAPRQRWGLTSQLPTIALSRSGSGTVGAGDTLFLIPQYEPVAPGDSIVEAHIQWDAAHPDSTVHRRAGRFGEPLGSGVSIRMQHVYSDTGTKHYRFRVRTAAGEQYESGDSVRVLLRRHYR